MATALVFAMKLHDLHIYLNDDLEEFIANIQPPITEENYSEILRCSESNSNEITECQKINYHENRLHLACKEKTDFKKVKQYISAGVIPHSISNPSVFFFPYFI
jgi:hypothetical protein